MKRQTKADRILNQSTERINEIMGLIADAELELSQAQNEVYYLYAALNAHKIDHAALEKELAPTPRKAAKKAAGGPVAQKEALSDKEPMCGLCGNAPGFQDHFKPSPNYHEFEGPKPVARAPRKSKQKSEATVSTQSIEDAKDSAISAPSGGD
jgi:hypothetical protein